MDFDNFVAAAVTGREKHIFSIYRKMIEKHLSFSEVHDIYGIRVVVKDAPTCYLALGAVQEARARSLQAEIATARGDRIERAGRFVHQDDFGFDGECARDAQALLLPAGKRQP